MVAGQGVDTVALSMLATCVICIALCDSLVDPGVYLTFNKGHCPETDFYRLGETFLVDEAIDPRFTVASTAANLG